MNHETILRKLRTVSELQEVEMEPASTVATPFFVLRGKVLFHGEPYVFQTEIKITEFNTNDDVARLASALLASVAKANDTHGKRQQS